MARRPTLRTNLRIERLESREVMTAGPSGAVTELWAWTNLARTNPAKAAQIITSDTDPVLAKTLQNDSMDRTAAGDRVSNEPAVAPLSFSSDLSNAAAWQGNYLSSIGQQTHDGPSTPDASGKMHQTLDQRVASESPGFTHPTKTRENIFAYATGVKNAMEAFLYDWGQPDPNTHGHLDNIYDPAFHDLGLSITPTNTKPLGPEIVTQVFGSSTDDKPMLVGVVFNDNAGDGLYHDGEGVGNLTLRITDDSGKVQDVRTWDAGGYQVALAPGHYTVAILQNGRLYNPQSVTIGGQNVEADFVLTGPLDPNGGTPVAPPASTPVVVTPMPTPTPAPVVVTPPPAPVAAAVATPPPVPVVVTPPTPTPAPVVVVVTPPTPPPAPVVVTPPPPAPVMVAPPTPAPVVVTPPDPTPTPTPNPTPPTPADPPAATVVTETSDAIATTASAMGDNSSGGARTEDQDASKVGSLQGTLLTASNPSSLSASPTLDPANPLDAVDGFQWETWDSAATA